MPRAQNSKRKELTRKERRERRLLRREKQRKDNIGRAAKMHAARLQIEIEHGKSAAGLKASTYVGCSGWFYWKWRGLFYPEEFPTGEWFKHYAKRLDTVEINASFYSWPTVANVKAWGRQTGKRSFVYTVKVCELITHIKRFRGTKTLIKDFGMIADILGDRMGCFLFQLPPSYRYTKARLTAILSSLMLPGVTLSNFGIRAGGMRRCTPRFARPAQSSALAAARDFRTSWSGRQTTSICACTAPRAGTGTIIRRTNSRNGPNGSKQAAPNEPGFTSITITKPMRRETQQQCDACWRVVFPRRSRALPSRCLPKFPLSGARSRVDSFTHSRKMAITASTPSAPGCR